MTTLRCDTPYGTMLGIASSPFKTSQERFDELEKKYNDKSRQLQEQIDKYEGLSTLPRDPCRLEIIYGCMSSGKSTELLRRVDRYSRGGYKCLCIKHGSATQYETNETDETNEDKSDSLATPTASKAHSTHATHATPNTPTIHAIHATPSTPTTPTTPTTPNTPNTPGAPSKRDKRDKRDKHDKHDKHDKRDTTEHIDDQISEIMSPKTKIITHSGLKQSSIAMTSLATLDKNPGWLAKYDVFAIDEVQFFPDTVDIVCSLLRDFTDSNVHKIIILAGLDKNYKGETYSWITQTVSLAEQVTHLTAVCTGCKHPSAIYSKRLNDDKSDVLIGGLDKYAAVCRRCFNYEITSKTVK